MRWARDRAQFLSSDVNEHQNALLMEVFNVLGPQLGRRSHSKIHITPATTAAGFRSVTINLLPLAEIFGACHQLAHALHEHCDLLGNRDDDQGTLAVALWQGSFAPLEEGLRQEGGIYVILQVLAFLIDHCRVMYRPLLLSIPLVAAVCAVLQVEPPREWFTDEQRAAFIAMTRNVQSPQDWFTGEYRAAFMPQPAPYFGRVQLGGKHFWLWVPVKKPHSSTFDGNTYLPLPSHEPALPLFDEPRADDDNPRPLKRPRTEACVSCGKATAATASHSKVFHACSRACVQRYYV